MLHKIIVRLLCVVVVGVCAKPSEQLTFKNVTVCGLSLFTYKFNVTIESSNSLKEHLPKSAAFDAIEIINSHIPILYENSISDIDSLDELILDNDNIREIRPGTFRNVPQLRKLVVKNNRLENVDEGVFNRLPISTLDLSKNRIKTVASGAFDHMPELLNINLADNRIEIWDPKWFADTPLLSRISLQNNLIRQIPPNAFENLAGEKRFGSVDLTLNIILSHNRIDRIDKNAFDSINKLHNLWLDNNKLASIEPDVLGNLKIDDLRLNENAIACLKGDLGMILVAQTNHIDGNPWDCQCLNAIMKWAENDKKDVQMFYSKLNCDAERIRSKIDALNKRLKELKGKTSDEIEDLA